MMVIKKQFIRNNPPDLHSYINNAKGAVLILSLMILLLLSLLATTVTMFTTTDILISNNYKTSKRAFFAAEAGIEFGRNSLLNTIRVNNKAWIDILKQNSDGDSTTQTSEILYGLNGGAWDSMDLTNNTRLNNVFVTGADGPTFSLRLSDNNDQDNDYTLDTDFIVILQSTGVSGNSTRTIQVSVSCPTCEDFYSQERYSPENPGSISTQSNAVVQTTQTTL